MTSEPPHPTYHALQILGMNDRAMTLTEITTRAIDQYDAPKLLQELHDASGHGLVIDHGGVWELTTKGRDWYVA